MFDRFFNTETHAPKGALEIAKIVREREKEIAMDAAVEKVLLAGHKRQHGLTLNPVRWLISSLLS